jgi:hypothetical protein
MADYASLIRPTWNLGEPTFNDHTAHRAFKATTPNILNTLNDRITHRANAAATPRTNI